MGFVGAANWSRVAGRGWWITNGLQMRKRFRGAVGGGAVCAFVKNHPNVPSYSV